MNRKQLLVLVSSLCLILALVLSACGSAGTETTVTNTVTATATVTGSAPPATTVSQDKTYKVLNPVGIPSAVECKALAARLDSLAGKKILFYESEATNMQLPLLLEKLKTEFPTSTFDVIYTASFGDRTATDAHKKSGYQAAIRGVSW